MAKDSYLFRDLRQAARDARAPGQPSHGSTTALPRIMLAPLTPGAGCRTATLALSAYFAESSQQPALFTTDPDPARARLYKHLLAGRTTRSLHPLPPWLIPGSMARFLLDKHATGSRWSLIEVPGGLFNSPNLVQPDDVLSSLQTRFKSPGVFAWPETHEPDEPIERYAEQGDPLAQAIRKDHAENQQLHRADRTESSDDPDSTDSPITAALPTGAAASLALDLAAPVILIVDIRTWGISSLATLRGLTDLVPGLKIAGLILNRVPLSQFAVWADLIYKATGLPVLLTIPELPLVPWPTLEDYMRDAEHMTSLKGGHTDAKQHTEHNLRLLIQALKEQSRLEIGTFLRFADEAPQLRTTIPASLLRAQKHVAPLRETTSYPIRIAVAQDEAFADYYRDNLDLYEELGAEILPFSPLNDNSLPPDIDGLILGGGPLEEHIADLSMRRSIAEQIRELVADGLPMIIEGEAFIYASENYHRDGSTYPMLSLVPGDTAAAEAGDDYRSQTGLLRMNSRGVDLRAKHGESLRVYDKHRFRVGKAGQAYRASLPGGRSFLTGHGSAQMSVITGYHYGFGAPQSAARFAKLCFERHRRRTGEEQGKLQGWRL